MKRQCRECKSAVNAGAPYCEACGFQMRRLQSAQRRSTRWKYRSAAILTGLAVAVAHYLSQR